MLDLINFQNGLKLLSNRNFVEARKIFYEIWIRDESSASTAARYVAYIDELNGHLNEAVTLLESSMAHYGEDPATLAQISELSMKMGLHKKAIDRAKRSLELSPNNAITALNKTIWQSNYSSNGPAIRTAFELWASRYIKPAQCTAPMKNFHDFKRSKSETLKVGFLSGDLKNHAVRYFIEPYLKLHDRSRIELHIFMTAEEDEISQILKQWVPNWHNVRDLNSNSLLSYIRTLEIKILVDLSGHTENSKLDVFAARAAPVQVTWWGFVHTLGIKEIDYRLTDYEACPPGAEDHYTEALCRMACLTAYVPPVGCEEEYSSPWVQNQFVTMVSLNHTRKISDAALNTWREILEKNQNAGLIIVTGEVSELQKDNYFVQRLTESNLPMDRVAAVPRLTMLEYMRVASVADFAVDTFPISGGVTTFHSLWMGLPILTMCPGNKIAIQTYAANVLSSIGLSEGITNNINQYVDLATYWIQNPSVISQLRSTIRQKMITSPFLDHDERVKELEYCFEEMWRRFLLNESIRSFDSELATHPEYSKTTED